MTRSRDTASIIPTVDAKGDLLVGTADNTVDNLSPGTNGQVLTANSATSTGLEWTTPASTGNLIINGAMQIAQRGSSATGIASTTNYFTADRWAFNVGAGTWTQTVENDAPAGSGFRKSIKILCTTAKTTLTGADIVRFRQEIEGQNLQSLKKGTANAEQLTLSFWVKSNVTGSYVASLFDRDNNRQVSAVYTISSSGSWEKKTIVFPADAAGVFDNDSASSMYLAFILLAGPDKISGTSLTTWQSYVSENEAVGQTANLSAATNNYWQITGVQLEAGAVATPYPFQNIQAELAACQRYYFRHSQGFAAISTGASSSTTTSLITVTLPVEMRANPASLDFSTLTISNYTSYTNAVTNLIIESASRLAVRLTATATGQTANQPTALATGSGGFLGFNAEL
jgi:hypothetical protein